MGFLEIDGSRGEGGGAVLRTALALSAVMGRPVRVYNVRVKRKKPGLQPQHLRGVEALSEVAGARVKGTELGSTEVYFEPGEILGGKYRFDIGTAGSTILLLQALLPPLAFASGPAEVEVTGGTDNPLAPPVDYFRHVTLPVLARMGYRVELECLRRGHYPKGGGKVVVRTHPVEVLRSLELTEAGRVERVEGISHCAGLPPHVATRQAHAAKLRLLKEGYGARVRVETPEGPSPGPGSGVVLWALTSRGGILGSSSLGRPGKPAEKVGREAAEFLLEELRTGHAVDRYLTDQLVPYVALAEGRSELWSTHLTLHALTNVELVEGMLGVKFSVEGGLGSPSKLSVEGKGFRKAN
ncbi:MAG: RNA 3'-terminal phosphate cyclase [Candidatus Hadarchaeales archaeon]